MGDAVPVRIAALVSVGLWAMLLSAIVSPAAAQSCTTTAAPVTFGSVDLLAGNAVDITGSVSIACTGTANTTVRACPLFSAGSGGAAGAIRYMTAGANSVSFNLFSDAGRTQVWGGSFGATTAPEIAISLDATGSGSFGGIPLYARVYPGQNLALAGTYASDIAITTLSGTTAGTCGTGATTGGAFAVTALYETTCTLSAPLLDFGNFASLASALDATTNLTVACSSGSAYQVSMDGGLAGATNPELRQMTRLSNTLTYALYRDTNRTQPWGNTMGDNTLSSTGTGSQQSHPVYGRIPTQAVPPPGTYSDTVVVTVTN